MLKLRDCFFLTGPKTKKNGNYEFYKVIDEDEDDDEVIGRTKCLKLS